MKKVKYLAAALVALAMAGCEAPLEKADFDYTQNSANAPAPGEISYLESEDQQTVTVRASVAPDSTLTDWGVVAYTDSMELKDYVLASALSADSVIYTNFEVTLSGLESDVEYTFCTYSENVDGITYGTPQKKAFTFAKWQSRGMATYTDDLIGGLFGRSPVTYEVEIQENEATPGLYRLVNPYGAAFPYNEPGQYDTGADYYLVINATDPAKVFLPQNQDLGVNWGYGSMGIYGTLEAGTLVDGIIRFPARGLVIYDDDGAYYANNNGAFMVALPGVTITDYSVSVDYVGRYTDIASSQNYVIMDVTFGPDVEFARVALIEGADVETAMEGIVAGTIESELITEDGEIELEVKADGVYTCVVVSYAGEEPQEIASASCKIYLESIGIDNFCGGFIMTGSDMLAGSDASLPVLFTKVNDSTLTATGLTFSDATVSYIETDKIISIAPQLLDSVTLANGMTLDLMLLTIDATGNFSTTAALDLACDAAGNLYIDDFSGAIGYMIYSNVWEAYIEANYGQANYGYVEAYYGMAFSPASMPVTKAARTFNLSGPKQLMPMVQPTKQAKTEHKKLREPAQLQDFLLF